MSDVTPPSELDSSDVLAAREPALVSRAVLPVKRTRTSAAWWLLCLVIPLTLPACSFRLVSGYDEQLDRAATALQQEMDAHLTNLETLGAQPTAQYGAHEGFYQSYGVQLRSVRVRAQGHARNQITLQQLDRMTESLEELRQQHERGGTLSPGYITTVRELFNSSWAAIIAWELAKKRGS